MNNDKINIIDNLAIAVKTLVYWHNFVKKEEEKGGGDDPLWPEYWLFSFKLANCVKLLWKIQKLHIGAPPLDS